MTQEIEIEYKTLLTESDYTKLLKQFHSTQSAFFEQTNVYYDTPDFQLKKLGCGLRIRLMPQSAELTLKSPLANSPGLLETTDSLSLPLAQSLIQAEKILPDKAVAQALTEKQIELTQLVVHGALTTKRLELSLEPDILLVLDESWYHGQHDYELEMEVTDPVAGEIFFHTFLKTHQIAFKPSQNKISRALAAKKNQ